MGKIMIMNKTNTLSLTSCGTEWEVRLIKCNILLQIVFYFYFAECRKTTTVLI